MKINAYINFNGRCDEALEFYKGALNARVDTVMRYKDAPEMPPPGMVAPGSENKVMHSSFRVGETDVMATDGYCGGQPEIKGISLTLTADDEAGARRAFDALAAGGQVQMPLGKTFFSPCFGMLADRFGVQWMIIVLG